MQLSDLVDLHILAPPKLRTHLSYIVAFPKFSPWMQVDQLLVALWSINEWSDHRRFKKAWTYGVYVYVLRPVLHQSHNVNIRFSPPCYNLSAHVCSHLLRQLHDSSLAHTVRSCVVGVVSAVCNQDHKRLRYLRSRSRLCRCRSIS